MIWKYRLPGFEDSLYVHDESARAANEHRERKIPTMKSAELTRSSEAKENSGSSGVALACDSSGYPPDTIRQKHAAATKAMKTFRQRTASRARALVNAGLCEPASQRAENLGENRRHAHPLLKVVQSKNSPGSRHRDRGLCALQSNYSSEQNFAGCDRKSSLYLIAEGRILRGQAAIAAIREFS